LKNHLYKEFMMVDYNQVVAQAKKDEANSKNKDKELTSKNIFKNCYLSVGGKVIAKARAITHKGNIQCEMPSKEDKDASMPEGLELAIIQVGPDGKEVKLDIPRENSGLLITSNGQLFFQVKSAFEDGEPAKGTNVELLDAIQSEAFSYSKAESQAMELATKKTKSVKAYYSGR